MLSANGESVLGRQGILEVQLVSTDKQDVQVSHGNTNGFDKTELSHVVDKKERKKREKMSQRLVQQVLKFEVQSPMFLLTYTSVQLHKPLKTR